MRTYIRHVNDGILVYDYSLEVKTAGPSPNNNIRAELFLLGCNKAQSGSPCEGCFNSLLWDKSKAKHSLDVEMLANVITESCGDNKYLTIGGGEPTDQIERLIELCKILKERDFHIMVYSWRLYEDMLNNDKYNKLFNYIDILVDGEYNKSNKMYDEDKEDGFLSSIGSGNQKIVDIRKGVSYAMSETKGLTLTKENELIFVL